MCNVHAFVTTKSIKLIIIIIIIYKTKFKMVVTNRLAFP